MPVRFSLGSTILLLAATTAAAAETAPAAAVSPGDWPWWRGPNRNGTADAEQSPPVKWSEAESVLWKSEIPGRGHSSPTVVGNRVFLATAVNEPPAQSVLCFDRETGDRLWKADVHLGGISTEGLKNNEKSSMASSTPACDGERVFINFLNDGAIYTTALDLDGNQIWQQKIDEHTLHQGFGSSPAIYGSLVLVSADTKSGGALAALDRASGKPVWKVDRPPLPNYTSPVVLHVDGRDQLFLTGCDLVSSFDPLTGEKLWEVAGATTECVTSTVTDGTHIFSSGGWPRNHVSAFVADGSGNIAWDKNTRVYVPSLLIRDGYLYAVLDAGVATCWKSDTGEVAWTERLGGNFTASPTLVGDLIYATDESGRTTIFKATPAAYEEIGRNEIPGEVLATPTVCGGRVFMRVAQQVEGQRQEFLYCIGSR